MLPLEYPYGGPVGSEGWGPNSPSGASFFVAQPFRDHPLYRKNVRLKRGARRGAGVRFETKFALPESLSLRDLYAALGGASCFSRESLRAVGNEVELDRPAS